MCDPDKIVTWLAENFQSMRASRRKTLAALMDGAMKMQGTGVLVLGRALQTLKDICSARLTPILSRTEVLEAPDGWARSKSGDGALCSDWPRIIGSKPAPSLAC